jgi:hypothetical protein
MTDMKKVFELQQQLLKLFGLTDIQHICKVTMICEANEYPTITVERYASLTVEDGSDEFKKVTDSFKLVPKDETDTPP